MSGFFKKLRLGKKKSGQEVSSDSKRVPESKPEQESWSEHEISHDIPQNLESTAKLRQPAASPAQFLDTIVDIDVKSLSLDTMENSMPNSDETLSDDFLEKAMDFNLDSIGDVTAEIQAEIAEERRIKKLYERRKLILEATDEFRQPNWDDDFLNKDK